MKVKTITCPNCSHANNFLAEDCSQCGIIFSKYYEELEKAEALRRHIEEQEKAEELKRQQEEEARLKEEQRRREEAEKAEALRKQQEEEARIEAEQQAEAQKRADILRRQKEELEKAEELRRQEEEKSRAEEERLRKVEEEKAEALRKQEEEEARQAEEARRQQEKEARAEEERLRKEEEEKAVQEERDRAAADMTGPLQMPVTTPDFRPAETLQARLSPYEGQMIGVSYGNPSEIQNVKLISVNNDHFQIYYPITKHVVSYAYRQLMLVSENPEGISAVGPDISPVFPVVIEVPRPFFHNS